MVCYENFFILLRHVFAEVEVLQEKPHVEETLLMAVKDATDLDKYIKYENVMKKNGKVILRGKNGEGSVMNVLEDVNTDSWSIEFQVKNLVLHDVEQAGFYVWYTDKEVNSGSYLGGNPSFNGFVAGIELSKDRADIVFSHNFGHDFKDREAQTVRYDHINPHLIDSLDQLIVKIIHTELNFKIEIYDQEHNLISDTFRIIEPLIMHKELPRKHFSITTKYNHCAKDISFDLSHLILSSRVEHESYDHSQISHEHNQYPRNKSDHELRVAIADISHFMNYLVLVLGTKGSNNILDMTMETKKKLRILQSSVDKLIEDTKKQTSEAHVEQSLTGKLEDLERTLSNNLLKIEGLRGKLNIRHKKTGIDVKGIILCGSLAGLILLVMLSIKDTLVEFTSKSEMQKKE